MALYFYVLMASNQNTLESIRNSMDLNIYEAKVYTALLSRGIASAGELADISGVPRSRCYDVLESLEKKGFVFMKIGKPIKYIGIEPKEVVETLKKKARMDQNHQFALFEELKNSETFDELKDMIADYIYHYNHDRPQWNLKKMTPAEYRNHLLEAS